MNNHTSTSPSPSTNPSVKDAVLTRIDQDHIKPRSRWFFHSRECVVWFLWFVSVLLGAVAVAVTIYVSMSVPYMLYEATHTNLLTAAVSVMPYVWLVVFIIMAYAAIINLRYTRRGYRYRTIELLGSSVIVSIVLGVGLYAGGGGYVLDYTIGSWVAAYPSYEKKRLGMWQTPSEGRMIGTLLPLDSDEVGAADEKQFVFHDIDEVVWQLDTSELTERDLALLHDSGAQQVRVVGTTTAPNVFHLCGVFPWESGNRATRSQLRAEREMFLETMQAHLATRVRNGQAPESEDAASAGPCSSITAVQRANQHLAQ